MANNPVFAKPITFDEFCQIRINSTSKTHDVDFAAILKEKLQDRRVQFCIDFSAIRTMSFRDYAQRWRDISDRNKFIMNISDEEVAEYIKNSQRSGISLDKQDLIGRWERMVSGVQHHYYEFLENDSFCHKSMWHFVHPVINDKIIYTYIYGGKWSLKDDTLFMVIEPKSLETTMDTSRISYRPEMRDSVRKIISSFSITDWKESIRKSFESNRRDTLPMTTNKAHDKLEIVKSREKDGSVKSVYLKRVKE